MIQGKLRYKVFEVSYETVFRNPNGRDECKSNDSLFTLQFIKTQNSGESHFSGSLFWSGKERPSVGLQILDLEIELAAPALDHLRVFQQGYQSWGFTTSYAANERDESPLLDFLRYNEENIYTNHTGQTGEFTSESLVLLYNRSQEQGVWLGVSDKGNQYTKFITNLNPNDGSIQKLAVQYDFYSSPTFRNNTGVALSSFTMKEFSTAFPEKELETYAETVAKNHGIAEFSEEVPTGWCSWYYYYTKISEDILLQNLEKLSSLDLGMEFFQIDDGYQAEIGDWLIPNNRFPNGLKPIVEAINSKGFKPGLWLAPFLVRKKSEFYRTYPEAVLKDEKGNPVPALWNPLWGWDYTYTLDASHPKTKEYLEYVFRTLTKDWGFVYLKLDFLYSASLIGVPYNRSLTPLERYRKAIEFIRDVVGKETFLLGCGAPLAPSFGLFDGMRIGCDVTSSWDIQLSRKLMRDKHALCTEKALINTLTRTFMHKTLWLNDPDCLLVRKDRNEMTLEQTIMMASIMGMSGGMLLVSDNMNTISEDRLDILRKALQLSKACCKEKSLPLGSLDHKFPPGYYNPKGILGLWNPSRKKQTISVLLPDEINLSDYNDFWTGKPANDFSFEKDGNRLKVGLDPFATLVLQK
ncbi:MAG: glycoside hydrolase family 36 protein [Spirochaetota bacterium]